MSKLKLFIALAVAVGAVAVPAVASASTISLEGNTLVFRAAPGETNYAYVQASSSHPGWIQLSDSVAPTSIPATCDNSDYEAFVGCPVPAGGVRFETGDGNDIVNVMDDIPATFTVTADGGPGDDTLRGPRQLALPTVLNGGDGNDKISGGLGADQIDGGAGDDDVNGWKGNDVVRGGAGNDKLLGDDYDDIGTDVIDGGDGFDTIDDNWMSGGTNYQPPINVSIDGVANDGRPGENDNVLGIEKIYLNAGATLTGSDAAEELTMFNSSAGGALYGRGGDDKLNGFDLDDTIDGGAGNDQIQGGYGNDTITGGPGRDNINGDASSSACNWIQCRMPYGNDTIDARDGEVDQVSCGIGEDTVQADAVDVVAFDCETVVRATAAAATTTTAAGATTKAATTKKASTKKVSKVKLSALKVKRSGRYVLVTGKATGATKITVKVLRGTRTTASVKVTVRKGAFKAKLRGTKGAKVTVTGGSVKKTLKVA